MALPNQINKAIPAGGDQANTYDDEMRAFKLAVEDILGIPDATNIAVALFSVVAGGLEKVILQDAAADPTVDGHLQRNASNLKVRLGGVVKTLNDQAEFSSGERMIFDQAAAPTGWTRDAVVDDRVIRIVSGARVDGGSWTISGLTVDSHVLTTAQMPSHLHAYLGSLRLAGPGGAFEAGFGTTESRNTESTGGGAGHVHGLTAGSAWRPLHRDMILCEKD